MVGTDLALMIGRINGNFIQLQIYENITAFQRSSKVLIRWRYFKFLGGRETFDSFQKITGFG
jgi:hypothetical protein